MRYRILLAFCALMGGHVSGMERHWAGTNTFGYGPCKRCGTWHWFGPYLSVAEAKTRARELANKLFENCWHKSQSRKIIDKMAEMIEADFIGAGSTSPATPDKYCPECDDMHEPGESHTPVGNRDRVNRGAAHNHRIAGEGTFPDDIPRWLSYIIIAIMVAAIILCIIILLAGTR